MNFVLCNQHVPLEISTVCEITFGDKISCSTATSKSTRCVVLQYALQYSLMKMSYLVCIHNHWQHVHC